MNFIIEGGTIFMVPMLLLLTIIIGLIIKGFKNNTEKNIQLIKAISLFSFVFGVLGFNLGMIGALDAIAAASDINKAVLAIGLKVGLIAPTFGLIIFLIGRLGAIILLWKQKE